MTDQFPMWAKFRPVFGLGGLVRRRSDGAIFEASNPGRCDLDGGWYFRRIRRWGPIWKRTGEVWQTQNHAQFDLIGKGWT